jgi:hypothetical protein
MTYQELAHEIVRLPLTERLALLELVTRSVREELAPRHEGPSSLSRIAGIGSTDGPPPTDGEIHDSYVDYLIEKYA